MELEKIGSIVVDAAFRIHRTLGPGLMESVYLPVLARDLARRDMHVEPQKWISFDYDGMWFENAFRADLIIERRIIVEVKSVAEIKPVHYMQLLTYLRLLDLRLGYLMNFGAPLFKDGCKRMVNNYNSEFNLSPRR